MTTREIRGGVEIINGVEAIVSDEGCGTELKKLLAVSGFSAIEGCACEAMARRMNRGGPQWCRENMDLILDTMEGEWRKRVKFIPPSRLVAIGFVETAILLAARPAL